jgi:hypothetical protein
VKCPGCDKNHLVADNLKWFEDKPISIVDIMKAQGEEVITGVVNQSSESITAETLATNQDVAKIMDEVIHIEGMSEEDVVGRLSHKCTSTCSH